MMATLTPREREVLGWVAAGKTNAQIGQILGTMPRTVAKHLERIYEKLGVETRTAAAMKVVDKPHERIRRPDTDASGATLRAIAKPALRAPEPAELHPGSPPADARPTVRRVPRR